MAETSLKKQIMSGMVWKFAERFIAQGVSFVVSLVLARILMPSDYGIIAIINVFITIADVLLTSGLNTALIQKQDVDELDFSTIFYCNFILGMGLYAILFVAAPFLATAYKMPLLKQAIRVFAIRLPISSFQSIQTAYISRKMDFKRFFFSTIIGTLVSAVVGIVMALKGAGVWALIAQYLTNTIIDTLFLFVTVRWHPRLMFSWKRAKPLIAYGSKVMMTDLIGTIFNNLGDFIVGLRYTTADLAYYTKGKQLPMLLKTNISTALISVLFPGMSQVNDENEKVKILSRQSVRMLSYIIFPLMAGMMVVDDTISKQLPQLVQCYLMSTDMSPEREMVRLAELLMAGAVERHRTDQYILAADRTLADYRGQRHAIDITFHQHRREDTSLRVEASVEHCRMPVKISLYLMRQDKAVAEDAVAVPLAGLALVKVMLTEVPL